MRDQRPQLCVLGAAGDTSNLGVDALLESTLAGVRLFMPDADVAVFDNGLGVRPGEAIGPAGTLHFERIGIRDSRRVHRPESLINMRVALRVPGVPNVGMRRLQAADAVLDLSGGDSFSDIYGPARFDAITQPKQLVLDAGSPLVLLPQTYGPFSHDRSRRRAAELVAGASMTWARDEHSFDVMRGLLDDSFDDDRHRRSVDVAFGLPALEPRRLRNDIRALLLGASPVFGVNVSGLLANDDASSHRFGLAEPYGHVVEHMLERLLDETDATVLLVPHVRSDLWVVESDIAACRRLHQRLRSRYPGRIAALENVETAPEVKWVIGQCDSFCGTRMHSAIAALSSETPALALAYSPKTAGVFASCGQDQRVVDLRSAGADAVADQTLALWAERERVRRELEAAIPAVNAAAREPFGIIARAIADRQMRPPHHRRAVDR